MSHPRHACVVIAMRHNLRTMASRPHKSSFKPIRSRDDVAFLPPHEPTFVPGFHAYGGEMRIKPGQTLSLHVSHDGPVRVEIVRLGRMYGDASIVAALGSFDAQPQPIHRGSYVHIENGPAVQDAMSVELWCRPLTTGTTRGLIDHRSFQLLLDESNRATFVARTTTGDITLQSDELPIEQWHHVVITLAQAKLSLHVNGQCVRDHSGVTFDQPGDGPMRLGALSNSAGQACSFYSGDLCAPAIYHTALSSRTIHQRHEQKALHPTKHCAARWAFDAVKGAPYRDRTRHGHHGRPVNYPIRMIPGPRRTIDSDWCSYDPTKDADFGHAVRLMADTLVDCRWSTTASWRAPRNIAPGQYAARITNSAGETRHVPFIIRPAKPRPGVKMMCLSTTNTRVAYNFQPFGIPAYDYGAYQHHPVYPLLGQLHGVHRPMTGEPWHRTTVEFELPFYHWLDHAGIAYDLYSEWDLEQDPSLAEHYDVIAFAGHSEYWTIAQHQTLVAHVKRGGHVFCMSGNTAYWRVSVDLTNQVMEVRKHDHRQMPGVNFHPMLFSAHHHQMDHLPGSCMRYAGYPETALTGLVTGGFTDPPLGGIRAGYRVLRPEHELFHHPHSVNTHEPFAANAAGYETDCCVRLMLERYGESKSPMYPATDGSPRPRLGDPFDAHLTVLARASLPASDCLDYDVNFFKGEMISDIVIVRRPGEGIIFAVGSVLSSHVLPEDDNFAKLLLNAMHAMNIEPTQQR